jgi:uncharacterized protein
MGGFVSKNEENPPLSDKEIFLLSCRNGDFNKCVSMIENGDQDYLTVVNSDGNNGLMISIIRSYDDIALLLIQKGIKLNIQNKYGDTPLILCCRCNRLKICQKLLKQQNEEINLNILNKKHENALVNAICNGSYEVTEFLFSFTSSTPPISSRSLDYSIKTKDGNTVLHLLCEKGWHKLCHDLIQKSNPPSPSVPLDLNHANNLGNTCLMISCQHSHLLCAEILLTAGADINLRNHVGDTSLTLACSPTVSSSPPSHSLISLLLSYHPNLNHQNSKGLSPLHLLCSQSQAIESISLLLSQPNLEKDLRDNEGNTPLILSVAHDNYSVTELLIQASVDLNVQNHLGDTALLTACKKKNLSVIELLLKSSGCDVNLRNKKGHNLADYDKHGDYAKLMAT